MSDDPGAPVEPRRVTGVTEQPSDNTTLVEVLAGYRERGLTGDLWAEEGPGGEPAIRCGTCDAVTPAGEVVADSIRRLEGASDPADMQAVVAATCPACGTHATLVLSYGPVSSAIDADVLRALDDRRGSDDLPRDAAPHEAPGDDPARDDGDEGGA